jgi:antitoxin HigA-1
MDNTLSPIHPGEVLREDFMKPLGLTQYRLAPDIGVTPIRISQIVNGKRAISVDTAMRLARYFGTSATVWLRMQVRYDLEIAQSKLSEQINREVKVLQSVAGVSIINLSAALYGVLWIPLGYVVWRKVRARHFKGLSEVDAA